MCAIVFIYPALYVPSTIGLIGLITSCPLVGYWAKTVSKHDVIGPVLAVMAVLPLVSRYKYIFCLDWSDTGAIQNIYTVLHQHPANVQDLIGPIKLIVFG